MFFVVFLSKNFHYWHKYQSLTKDVSFVVGAPWRCGVLTTKDGVGKDLGWATHLGESIQNLEWGGGSSPVKNEASPDCIVVVFVGVVAVVVDVVVVGVVVVCCCCSMVNHSKIIMIVRKADLSENCFANLSVKCVFLLHVR